MEFEAALAQVAAELELVSNFAGMDMDVMLRCTHCHKTFVMSAEDALRNLGCLHCGWRPDRTDDQLANEEKALRSTRNTFLYQSPYRGPLVPITCQCRKCGEVWALLPRDITRGVKCPSCSTRPRVRPEFALHLTDGVQLDFQSAYRGDKVRMEVSCPDCGHTRSPLPRELTADASCPHCSPDLDLDLR